MEITFNYNGFDIPYQCKDTKETFQDIFHKIRNDVDNNSIIFLYSGYQINGNLPITKIVNSTDLERNKMSIIVTDKNKEPESVYIKSKDIICPKCGECAKLDISEYKISLQCINKHNLGNILLNEYDNTQKVDISKIECDECKLNNKAKSYKNIFYRCNECNKNLCINCKDKHENNFQEHNIINYDNKNYLCSIHNFNYTSYCKKCNKNICIYCNDKHNNHEIINFVNILPNINDAKMNINKLRNDIDKFKEIVDDLIIRLNMVKENIEFFYNIDNNIYNSLKNKHITYELLYSFNKLNESDIINDINEIIKNENNRYQKLNEMYNKMNYADEITIQYLIKDNENEVKIFGGDFVENNKDHCKIIIEGKEMELQETIELTKMNNNILEIKLKGIQNIIYMTSMFCKCPSLYSLPDISKMNTRNISNMTVCLVAALH